MSATESQPLRIHFAGYIPGKRLIPLAQVCGLSSEQDLLPARYLTAYNELADRASELWSAAEIDEADVVVFPHLFHIARQAAHEVALEAKRRGLPCVFFQPGDNSSPASPPYGAVFRTSILANERTSREHAMAAHCDDMLDGVDELPIREKPSKPSIGFCGNVGNRWIELAYLLLRKTANIKGTRLRRRVIRRLQRFHGVNCRFILRDKWWGGALTRQSHDMEAQRRLREEYVENMLQTDYMLCIRGAGNYSFRFYEALSAGRIPLLIDTQCVLPFEDDIDWDKHCVIVPESAIKRAGDILAEYHRSLSPEEFQERQRANRALWEQWLRPVAFYQHALTMACETCNAGANSA